jgi:hypothetical protein
MLERAAPFYGAARIVHDISGVTGPISGSIQTFAASEALDLTFA